MLLKAPVGLKGIFESVEVLRADGSVKLKLDRFDNLITDIGLARLASPQTGAMNSAYNILRVSTDNTPPSPSDIDLLGQVATTSALSSADGTGGVNMDEGYCWRRFTWTFPLGAINNQNISKLATGWGTGSGTLFSTALIRDSNGDPTSITILSDEQLRVTWEHRRYWPTEDVTGTLVNAGNKGGTYTYAVRAAKVGSWDIGNGNQGGISIGGGRFDPPNPQTRTRTLYRGGSSLGDIADTIDGSAFGQVTATSTESAGAASVSSLAVIPVGQGVDSTNGIGGMTWGSGTASGSGAKSNHAFQCVFDPPIMKTAEDILEIEFQINWGRA